MKYRICYISLACLNEFSAMPLVQGGSRKTETGQTDLLLIFISFYTFWVINYFKNE